LHTTNFFSDSNPQLGVADVVEVQSLTSILSITQASDALDTSYFYAKRTVHGPHNEIKIYCARSDWLDSILRRDGFKDAIGAVLVDSVVDADIRVIIEQDRVFFERQADDLITPYIGQRLPGWVHVKDVNKIAHVLKCAIQFRRHLARKATDEKFVEMELNYLNKPKNKDSRFTILTPLKPNLLKKDRAVIIVDEEDEFALTLHNQTDRSWYPYLFYFDPAHLIIGNYLSFTPAKSMTDRPLF
jgi:hypothetical protein